jgi:hypothetical protein
MKLHHLATLAIARLPKMGAQFVAENCQNIDHNIVFNKNANLLTKSGENCRKY